MNNKVIITNTCLLILCDALMFFGHGVSIISQIGAIGVFVIDGVFIYLVYKDVKIRVTKHRRDNV